MNPQDPPTSNLKHIGIIMDGNRRYGKTTYGPAGYLRGHFDGGKKLEEAIGWCCDLRASTSPLLTELTVYAFSSENFSRPQTELDGLWTIFISQSPTLSKQCRDLNVRARILNTCGFARFPPNVVKALKSIESETASCTGLNVNVCVGYSGSEDVCRAAESLSQTANGGGGLKSHSLTPECILPHLQIKSQIDLLIRTSGEARLSNFALFNLAYAELLFFEKAWPEVTKEDFVQATDSFENRDRRYGK